MKRDIYQKLLEWKSSRRRKPLLLQGARQTGKTYILKAFGESEYEHLIYCNFEEDTGLGEFFRRDLNPERILRDLSIYYDHKIKPETDLLVFDEIQTSNRALNALKYFEDEPLAGAIDVQSSVISGIVPEAASTPSLVRKSVTGMIVSLIVKPWPSLLNSSTIASLQSELL